MRKFPLFNKTAFRKNVTRFAPVWILYTLGLLALLTLAYVRDTSKYWSFQNLMQLPQVMGVVNLLYALLVAQLLFGDLFSNRMCGALHALPLRRETLLMTNVASGLAFSFFPTLVMALAMLPVLAGSMFAGAWKLPFLVLLAANLEFVCFYGIAVFCVMCTGNRFTMAAGYGLVNAGAAIAYWMVNTLYTPMLHGVVTPSILADELTPIMQAGKEFFTYTDYSELAELARLQNCEITNLTGAWATTGEWWRFFALAGFGIALMIVALLLYRKRNLECAGDAVAFSILRPVFQVLCSLFVMVTVQYAVKSVLYLYVPEGINYVFLAVSLAIGWFIGRMLLERSLRVFGKQSWQGLGILAVVMALSLVGTHFDVFGIAERMPDLQKVESINFGTSYTMDYLYTEEQDMEKILRLHSLALEEKIENSGLYVRGLDGAMVEVADTNDEKYDMTQEDPEMAKAVNVRIIYNLKNGRTMERRYNVWADGEAGQIGRELLSRWEIASGGNTILKDGTEVNNAQYTVENVLAMEVNWERTEVSDLKEAAASLLEAMKADCQAGTMTEDSFYHMGYFRSKAPAERWDGVEYYEETEYISVSLRGYHTYWQVSIYPDCENCLRWLQDHDLMDNWEIRSGSPEWNRLWEASTQDAMQ